MQITQAAIDNVRKIELNGTPRNSLLFLHNHPKNSTFSETDLESFLTADSILMATVVCNNGKQYFLAKTPLFDKYKALVYYDEVYGLTEEGGVKEFLRTCKIEDSTIYFQNG